MILVLFVLLIRIQEILSVSEATPYPMSRIFLLLYTKLLLQHLLLQLFSILLALGVEGLQMVG